MGQAADIALVTQKDSQRDDNSGAARPPETQPCRPADSDVSAEPGERLASTPLRDEAGELADAQGYTDAAADVEAFEADETELTDLPRSDAGSSSVPSEDAERDEPAEVAVGEISGVSSFEDVASVGAEVAGAPEEEPVVDGAPADLDEPASSPTSSQGWPGPVPASTDAPSTMLPPVTDATSMTEVEEPDARMGADLRRDDGAGEVDGCPPAEDDAPEASAVEANAVRDEFRIDGSAEHNASPQVLDAHPEADDSASPQDLGPLVDSGHEQAGTDDAASAEADSPIVVRTGWSNPPPLTTQPSWVVRDVAPDTVPASVGSPIGETSGDDASSMDTRADAVDRAEPEADFAGWRQELLQSRPASEPASPDLMPIADEEGSDERFELPEPEAPPKLEQVPPPSVSDEPVAPPAVARYDAEWREPEPPTASADFALPHGFRSSPPIVQPPPLSRPLHAHASAADVGYDDSATLEPSRWDRAKGVGRTALRYAGYAVAGYFAFVFALILLYRFVNPPFSSLMVVQALTGTSVHKEWVPLEEISPALVRAVIVSEDWSFCAHYGIDIKAIEEAIERSGDGIPRGASTISMQTTKNLFLWNAKSYIRKAVEVPLTLMIELIWPKWRILEIYLNVAEWGPGVFGAEAAAQYHFNKPASRLGEREAAQLAASLPNPIIREAGDPGPRTARKASVIQSRMRNAGGAANCVLSK